LEGAQTLQGPVQMFLMDLVEFDIEILLALGLHLGEATAMQKLQGPRHIDNVLLNQQIIHSYLAMPSVAGLLAEVVEQGGQLGVGGLEQGSFRFRQRRQRLVQLIFKRVGVLLFRLHGV